MSISFVLPHIKLVHYKGLRKIGESKFGAYKWLAHYDQNGRPCRKTVKTPFGEPNHYDRMNKPIGYSRKRNRHIYLHYDCNGKLAGYSRRLLGVIWVHRRIKKRK